MKFYQAFKQIDWTPPQHTEKRNVWAAKRSNIKKISDKDEKNIEVTKKEFDSGVKNNHQVARNATFYAKLDQVQKQTPLMWKYIYSYFKPL